MQAIGEGARPLAVRVDGGPLLIGRRLREQTVEAAREVALEGPQRAFRSLALGFLAVEVLLCSRVVLGTGDRDDVQSVIEMPVSATVEPVLNALPRGARDRRGPRLQREARLRAKALVASGVADQDRGGQRTAPELGKQLRSMGAHEH